MNTQIIKEAEAGKIYSVLVTEDHPLNLHLALTILGGAGYETDYAVNGEQALVKLDATDFDLVVMDIQMPLLDGIEATKRIRRRSDWKSRIPILALTADATLSTEARSRAAGATAHMSKPFNIKDFVATVTALAVFGRAVRLNTDFLASSLQHRYENPIPVGPARLIRRFKGRATE